MVLHVCELSAAIQLSNVGVSLARRQLLGPAAKCFNDAITIVRMLSSSQRPTDSKHVSQLPCYHQEDHRQEIQQRLLGYQRLLSNVDPRHDNTANQIDVEVISDMDIPPLMLPTNSSATELYQMVHIDLQDVEGGPSQNDLSLVSSTILYNYAITYFCLASKTSNSDRMNNMKQGAMSLLVLSYNNIILQAKSHDIGYSQDKDLTKILAITILILGQLVTQSNQLGMIKDSERYSGALKKVKTAFVLHGLFMDLANHPNAAGAA